MFEEDVVATKLARASESRLPNQPLLATDEVAELLNVPASWVYERERRRASNPIPGFRLGKYGRFREADVLAWVEGQRVGT